MMLRKGSPYWSLVKSSKRAIKKAEKCKGCCKNNNSWCELYKKWCSWGRKECVYNEYNFKNE